MIPYAVGHFKTFIGVHLGGGRGKTTSVSLVSLDTDRGTVTLASRRSPEGHPWYDNVLAGFLAGQPQDALVAVDAPLTLPVCVRCARDRCPGEQGCEDPAVKWFVSRAAGLRRAAGPDRGNPGAAVPASGGRPATDPRASEVRTFGPGRGPGKPAVTPYTQRVTEVYLHGKHGVSPREALGQSMGPVAARAQHLAKRLRPRFRLNSNLIEVFPKATLHILYGRRCADSYRKSARIWEARAVILEYLSEWLDFQVWREPVLRNTHVFESVICAVTGMLWARQRWSVPEEFRELALSDGWIWVPERAVVPQ